MIRHKIRQSSYLVILSQVYMRYTLIEGILNAQFDRIKRLKNKNVKSF